MFLSAVSGGLIALGLMASAAGIGRAFYALALVLLPTLAFVGVVTFDRVLQTGVEDHEYARRIAHLRGYYFQYAPELVDHLLSVPSGQRLGIQGLRGNPWQRFVTVAGMVSVVTAVLAGSGAGILGAVLSGANLVAALVTGVVVGGAVMVILMHIQAATWRRVSAAALFAEE
jgi:hypothetical protein